MTAEELLKLKRRIVNFIHQFASEHQLTEIAKLLGIPERKDK